MSTIATPARVDIPNELIEAIRSFPLERIVGHCGKSWSVSPFEIYADCPHCGAKIKVRSFSGCGEIEDVFYAVWEWMEQPGAETLARRRPGALERDDN